MIANTNMTIITHKKRDTDLAPAGNTIEFDPASRIAWGTASKVRIGDDIYSTEQGGDLVMGLVGDASLFSCFGHDTMSNVRRFLCRLIALEKIL